MMIIELSYFLKSNPSFFFILTSHVKHRSLDEEYSNYAKRQINFATPVKYEIALWNSASLVTIWTNETGMVHTNEPSHW